MAPPVRIEIPEELRQRLLAPVREARPEHYSAMSQTSFTAGAADYQAFSADHQGSRT